MVITVDVLKIFFSVYLYLCFYCVLSCLSCLLLHPVLLCFLSSVCMLYVYGCFGEINYDTTYADARSVCGS